ncbi:MAG: hypothetical protein AB7R40_22315 [Nitrospiraceae bacterium]
MTRGIVVGDRVVYVGPVASTGSATESSPSTSSGAARMTGTVLAVSGVSALVQYDGERWPLWGPVERMALVVGVEGQLSLF